jgi:hypothetical protein
VEGPSLAVDGPSGSRLYATIGMGQRSFSPAGRVLRRDRRLLHGLGTANGGAERHSA